jgi:hypothetical protein
MSDQKPRTVLETEIKMDVLVTQVDAVQNHNLIQGSAYEA